MKKILWIIGKFKISFNVNFLEAFILKKIVKKQKYKITANDKKALVNKKFDFVFIDEWATIK